MKKADIKIGSVYRAKVSDKVTDVRIDAENAGGGWDATNLATKKKVRIKSAQRLRAPSMTGAEAKAVATPANGKAKTAGRAKTAKAATRAKSGGEKPKARTGILDAAAQILAKAKGSPLSVA